MRFNIIHVCSFLVCICIQSAGLNPLVLEHSTNLSITDFQFVVHPAGTIYNFEWFVNSFMINVYENFLKFSQNAMSKE